MDLYNDFDTRENGPLRYYYTIRLKWKTALDAFDTTGFRCSSPVPPRISVPNVIRTIHNEIGYSGIMSTRANAMLVGDVVSVCRHPIRLLFLFFDFFVRAKNIAQWKTTGFNLLYATS